MPGKLEELLNMVATASRGFEARELSTDRLFPSPVNARKEVGDITELCDSIREQGILEPLVVRPGDSGTYEVIIGSRRLACAKQLGMAVVPVVIQRISDSDAIVRSLVENLHRGDLSLEERVIAYRRLSRFDPERFGSTKGLSRAIGRSHQKIVEDFQAYEAMQRLRPSGVEVASNLPPQSAQRRSRSAIPERHATMLEQAMASVRSRIPDDQMASTYENLARMIAPLDQEKARRLLDIFKMYPDKPLSEIESMALSTIEKAISLPAETARQIDEMASSSGGRRDWSEVIADLVQSSNGGTGQTDEDSQEAPAPPPSPSVTRVVSRPSSEREPQEAPTVQYELFGSPEEVTGPKLVNKSIWNIQHASIQADFYTVGFAGKEISELVHILAAAGVTNLVDIRHSRLTPYKPEYNNGALEAALKAEGIEYAHHPELGVPSELPAHARTYGSKEDVWDWYDDVVVQKIDEEGGADFVGKLGEVVAFLDADVDPTQSHRHRLFLALERAELRGYDL